ncbi:MAG: LEA type 2 family protein [Desulfobulbaceae bacterium]|nr:LEA type 2 family protein [Desulfobulbaceae bacterium]
MQKNFNFLLLIFTLCFLCGCAGTMRPGFEPPVVSLHTFKMLPQESVTPRFEIGLHIINPNRDPLNFKGIFYTVGIEGYNVLSGVSNDLPTIEPYGEANIILLANVDLFKGIKLITSLLQEPRDTFKYSFDAKLDLGGFSPYINLQEEGEFNLRNER